MKMELCPICHKTMTIKKYLDETTVTTVCKNCRKTFKLTFDEKRIPSNINSFNWGAFFLWHLWGFWNGMPILACLGLILGLGSSTYYPLLAIEVIISLYLGINGNVLSWEKKEWKSPHVFEQHQKKWNIAVLIMLGGCFIVGFISTLIYLNY